MDCETCGRYRPSSEVLPATGPDGRLRMRCAACRAMDGAIRALPGRPALTAGAMPGVLVTSA